MNKQTPSGVKYNFQRAIELLDEQAAYDPLIAEADLIIDEQLMTLPKGGVFVFPESYLNGFEPAYTETEVHPYLAGRAISCTTARRLDIRWDENDQRVCFPIRDFHGRLCGVHGRAVDDSAELKYRVYLHQGKSNTEVWFGEHWLDFDKTVVITESVFDLASVWPVWQNVITPRMSGFTDAALKRLDGLKQVVSLFDSDSAGDNARARLDKLKGASITHLSVAPYKDPGETPEQVLVELLTPFLNQSSIFVGSYTPF